MKIIIKQFYEVCICSTEFNNFGKIHGINLDKTATVFPVCNTNQSHANTTMLLVIDRFQYPFGGAGMRLFECSVRSK